ncbi:MAG: transglutaminase domain-containing protein [Betaproteobacteria bacterium]
MLYALLHHTIYRYSPPAAATVQLLRLTPRAEPHQRSQRWRLHAPGKLAAGSDGYGNATHTLTHRAPHAELAIEVRGEIEVDALRDGRLDETRGLPPQVFLAATMYTLADAAVAEFAHRHLRGATAAALMDFALAVSDTVRYTPGATDVNTTAAQALALRRGVCQDQAHLFLAACRARDVPARYVSGYYYTTRTPHAASHAWVDAWTSDHGWVSFDITHRCFAGNALVRLAVGRDYASAAPVRGVRYGGGAETLEVRVNMRPLHVDGAEDASR